MKGWIGVDLDGTLARYDHWRGEDHIGEPIPAMVGRVQGWIAEGEEVRIFTARASLHGRSVEQRQANVARIKAWCVKHIGRELDVTSDKDWVMKELWDDRAIAVVPNKGITRFDRERTLADALETVMIQMGQLEKMFDGDEEFMLALEIGRKAMEI